MAWPEVLLHPTQSVVEGELSGFEGGDYIPCFDILASPFNVNLVRPTGHAHDRASQSHERDIQRTFLIEGPIPSRWNESIA